MSLLYYITYNLCKNISVGPSNYHPNSFSMLHSHAPHTPFSFPFSIKIHDYVEIQDYFPQNEEMLFTLYYFSKLYKPLLSRLEVLFLFGIKHYFIQIN